MFLIYTKFGQFMGLLSENIRRTEELVCGRGVASSLSSSPH